MELLLMESTVYIIYRTITDGTPQLEIVYTIYRTIAVLYLVNFQKLYWVGSFLPSTLSKTS